MKQAEFYFTFEIRRLARVTYENFISLPEKKRKKRGYGKETEEERVFKGK